MGTNATLLSRICHLCQPRDVIEVKEQEYNMQVCDQFHNSYTSILKLFEKNLMFYFINRL